MQPSPAAAFYQQPHLNLQQVIRGGSISNTNMTNLSCAGGVGGFTWYDGVHVCVNSIIHQKAFACVKSLLGNSVSSLLQTWIYYRDPAGGTSSYLVLLSVQQTCFLIKTKFQCCR